MTGIILLLPIQYLGDTSMTDSQLSANHTRSYSSCSHLNDLQPNMIWKRTAIDEHSSKLVDSALALEGVAREEGRHGRQGRVGGEGLQLAAFQITPIL